MKKDTIYVDAEDEISAVADIVANSKAKVVALVLPKRCTMLHSSVNMKILNKAAKNAGKQIVLISNEQALLPIAAASSVYIAKTLSSKPTIPELNPVNKEEQVVNAELDEEPNIDLNKPIGELAGDEAIEINDPSPVIDAKNAEKPIKAKDKKLKVPNFDSFRMKLFGGLGVLILLLVIGYLSLFVWPKATIDIASQSQDIPVSVEVTANPKTTSDNVQEKSFVLQTKSIEKSYSKSGNTTGTQNVGQKASGSLTITNCESTSSITVPKGTTVTASGPSGYRFTTNEDVKVPGSGAGPGFVCNQSGKADVTVTAAEPGGSYNISARSYTIGGGLGNLFGFGSAMAGGTDEQVKVVAEADCESLKASIASESNSDAVKQELIKEFEQDGLSASLESYQIETVSSSCEPAIGQRADQVTAKATYKYTMSGVSSESLGQLITQEAQKTAGDNLTINDTGLAKAVITVDKRNGSELTLTVKTTATAGVNQDTGRIIGKIKGKNARETSDIIKSINGVNDVKIDYSPFWVRKTPTSPDKIIITFDNQTNGQ